MNLDRDADCGNDWDGMQAGISNEGYIWSSVESDFEPR